MSTPQKEALYPLAIIPIPRHPGFGWSAPAFFSPKLGADFVECMYFVNRAACVWSGLLTSSLKVFFLRSPWPSHFQIKPVLWPLSCLPLHGIDTVGCFFFVDAVVWLFYLHLLSWSILFKHGCSQRFPL